MLVLALTFVPVLLVPAVTDIPAAIADALEVAGWLIWAAFAFELVVNTYLSERRVEYLVRHWFDLAIVLLPFLRPLRLVRSARLLRLLGAARLVAVGARAIHTVREILRTHGLQYVLTVALILLVIAAAAVTHFERGAGGTINSFGTGLWWAVTTVTTVGYGDAYPVTPEGRGIGVFVMLMGIGLFGTLTASVAAFFVTTSPPVSETTLDDVVAEIRRLEARLDRLTPGRGTSPAGLVAGRREDEAAEHVAE